MASLLKKAAAGEIAAGAIVMLNVTGGGFERLRSDPSAARLRPDLVIRKDDFDPIASSMRWRAGHRRVWWASRTIFAKCGTDGGYFGEFRHSGDDYFTQPVMESLPGRRMRFAGKDCVMWSINNYLGLAESEEVKAVAREALEAWGTSAPMGARMMSGNTAEHLALEEASLAEFAGKESLDPLQLRLPRRHRHGRRPRRPGRRHRRG